MKALLASVIMGVCFWIPATTAVMMMASSIPMKNLQLAIIGTALLLASLLFRFLIQLICEDENL